MLRFLWKNIVSIDKAIDTALEVLSGSKPAGKSQALDVVAVGLMTAVGVYVGAWLTHRERNKR